MLNDELKLPTFSVHRSSFIVSLGPNRRHPLIDKVAGTGENRAIALSLQERDIPVRILNSRTPRASVRPTYLEAPTLIPRDVATKLGYYVYAYVNPLDRSIFYVGKGKGQRALRHIQDAAKTRKAAIIRQIRSAGKLPQIDLLAHGLRTPEAALRVEAAVIDALGLPTLSNKVRGWQSVRLGRRPLSELIALYRRKPVRVREPAILIRINRLYRPQPELGSDTIF